MVIPTQQQLATLAASLPEGSPAERVNIAYSIWRETAAKLHELNETAEEKYHRERDEKLGCGEECDAIPFSQFLRELMPKKSIKVRKEQWEKFLMHRFRNHEESAKEIMRQNEVDGIDDMENQTRAFLAWADAKTKKSRIARAKKGANAKLLKEDEKRLKKFLEI